MNTLTRQLTRDSLARHGRSGTQRKCQGRASNGGIVTQAELPRMCSGRRTGLNHAMDRTAVAAFDSSSRNQCVLPGRKGERDHFRALVVADLLCAESLIGHIGRFCHPDPPPSRRLCARSGRQQLWVECIDDVLQELREREVVAAEG